MSEPALLMLDEPSLGLAPAVVDQLYDALYKLHEEGLTLLLAEQSIPLALAIADYAYVLQTGRTVLEGTGGGAGEQRAGAGDLSGHQGGTISGLILVSRIDLHRLDWPMRWRAGDRLIRGPRSPDLSAAPRPSFH